ncbi:GntR family transcriptional regulator [Natranaerobius thermophilus]|uniref:Transcriptional regulator, GntR family n=1 Tax=Natranaerobius thermophilus (strain ATCC BAA-1301 / DSM 18059 / JW/NM-WN-LF) TaxID=457570 RepID=B2A0M2_NATTJ|nr:GntR family transcriptional regulator [Natranaerobius thermophilus]ACB84580.1 transcriptional regulator, GntR family [Natranaerobius thermophilus JW/NM-WN-LF]
MWINIDPREGTPIFIQIKSQIKNAIASGALEKGKKLPSVRKLSKDLTVNPNTVSKAYQELENEGIIKKERGIGMFVAETSQYSQKTEAKQIFSDNLEKLLVEAYHLNLSEEEIRSLFEEKLSSWKSKFN